MNNIEDQSFNNVQNNRLSFHGKGSTFFGIVAVNVLLTLITLGLYYPWAKTAYRKYIWNESEFKDSRFVFNGTGKEVFFGFLIMYGSIILFYASIFLISTLSYGFVVLLCIYLLILILIPFAIFGGWKYRVSRTSWRGIFFSFDGDFKEFLGLFIKNIIFTLLTFGIYGAWMRVDIQKYLLSHTKIGKLRFNFRGTGGDLFGINIVGALLLYPTLFLYIPIFLKNRFNFSIENTYIEDGNNRQLFVSTLKNGEAWKTLVVNGLLLIVTVGFAYPWTFMRTMKMYMRNVIVPDAFDYDSLEQTEEDYKDATGDELTDIMDIDFGF
jgi:uncharacterized membrane protein YjgN (DUF898 family)